MVRNLRPGMDWIRGVVVEQFGPVTYLVDMGQDRIWKRHTDQLKSLREQHRSIADGSVQSPSSSDPVPSRSDVSESGGRKERGEGGGKEERRKRGREGTC